MFPARRSGLPVGDGSLATKEHRPITVTSGRGAGVGRAVGRLRFPTGIHGGGDVIVKGADGGAEDTREYGGGDVGEGGKVGGESPSASYVLLSSAVEDFSAAVREFAEVSQAWMEQVKSCVCVFCSVLIGGLPLRCCVCF